MKVVIDIPNWLYNAIIECKEPIYSQSLGDAVRDGTPLPKGHGDLIDREKLLSEIEKEYANKLSTSEAKAFVEFMAYIDEEPKPVIEADKGDRE